MRWFGHTVRRDEEVEIKKMLKLKTKEGRKAADEFCFEDVELECVGEFAYLGNMLNDTGWVEQAVRAAWMKFRELSGIL